MNITISSVFTAGAQLGFCLGGWGSLNPKINLFLKKSQLGAVLSKVGLTHAHHRRGLAVEPQAAGQLCFLFFLLRNLLFEHHSNQVWYVLEPSEKNNALNFESQLKN